MEAERVRARALICAPGLLVYCPDCGTEYSASPGDYFMLPADEALHCRHDVNAYSGVPAETPCILAKRETRIVPA